MDERQFWDVIALFDWDQAGDDDGDGYISADDFLYSRCVVVANGRELYETVLAVPAEMPQGLELESLLYLASLAYELRTGGEYEHVPPVDYESFQNADGWSSTASTRSGGFTGPDIPSGNRRPT